MRPPLPGALGHPRVYSWRTLALRHSNPARRGEDRSSRWHLRDQALVSAGDDRLRWLGSPSIGAMRVYRVAVAREVILLRSPKSQREHPLPNFVSGRPPAGLLAGGGSRSTVYLHDSRLGSSSQHLAHLRAFLRVKLCSENFVARFVLIRKCVAPGCSQPKWLQRQFEDSTPKI